ncbi:hypothetical protein R3P38DRAFT_3202868 [Favolaschia claudopus]|uniref:Uncharacterized protein n=1 Tax=Favolaschia claudopus TaxID=2862362 RepID=A0AAW0AVB3_9AGAR
MSLEEWLGRTTGPDVWSVQLEAWLDRYLSNNRNIRGADSSCSYLCSEQGFDVFFVVEGNEKEWLAPHVDIGLIHDSITGRIHVPNDQYGQYLARYGF